MKVTFIPTKWYSFLFAIVAGGIISGSLTSCQSGQTGETDSDKAEFQETHRNQIHFSPDSMWMNDPNGMVYYDGEYHLFYQHNPDTNVWGPMHWGHAVSEDLVHWKHLPIALYPDSLGMIFSGSAVIDWNNTSGFGTKENPPMIAIFTYHDMEAENAGKIKRETQAIAYSLDKGRTWTKYKNNPVLDNPGIKHFRDPKVIWHEKTQKWIMVLAAQDRVRLYSSPDLKAWEYESSFGKNAGAHGGVWECPDLFPLQAEGDSAKEKWVMLVNVNPGGPNGGSATQYFIGDFDGHSFTPDTKTKKWADYGKDNYAGVTWSDIPEEDGRRIYLGWMSNWEYAENVPTYHWRNSMTLPRTVKLKNKNGDYQLRFSPVKELQTLRTEKTVIKKKLISGSEELTKAHSIPSEIKLDVNLHKKSQFGSASKFGMRLSNGSNEELLLGYNEATEQLYIDRRNSGKTKFAETFPTVQRAPLKVDNKLSMHIYVDKASVEVFVNGGERVMTSIIFPNQVYDSLDLFAENGSVYLESAKVYQLNSIWK